MKKKVSKYRKRPKKMYPDLQEQHGTLAHAEDDNSYNTTDSYLCEEVYEHNDDTVHQDADEDIDNLQYSGELIVIKDSENINIQSTDTQVAVNVQVALQVAIALVLQIAIADSSRAEQVTQDLLQQLDVKQINRQKVLIENSRDVTIVTTDTDVSASVQVLLQVLLAIVAKIEVA